MGKEKEEKHRHHRKPRSLGGSNCEGNLSLVKATKHDAWHRLFKNFDAVTICSIINDKWLDTDFEFICVPRGYKED